MFKVLRVLSTLIVVLVLAAACTPPAAPTAAPADTSPTTAAVQPASPTEAAPAVESPTEAPVEAPAAEPKAITGQIGANDPRSIDPQRAVDTRDWGLVNQFFPSMAIQDLATNELVPAMAKDWEVSDDGLTYTFHMLENVPWVRYNADSGQVEEVKDDSGATRYVTAADFVYGFLRALNPETGSPAAYMLAPYIQGGMEYNGGTGTAEDVGLKAVDDFTFEVTAPEKVGFTLAIYSIINAKATPAWQIEAAGDSWTEPESIHTYGPYALQGWEHEATMTLIKNPFWPGNVGIGQAKIDEVTLKFIDEVVGLRDFEAGSLDWTIVPGDQIARIQSDPALAEQLKIVPGVCIQAWNFNTTKPPFDNVHIRRAFNYSVDRQSLVDNVLTGGQTPAVFYTPPGVPGAPSGTDAAKAVTLYDPEKAKEELALGLADLGLTSVDQLPKVTVEFGNAAELSAVGQTLQAMWLENLGIQTEIAQIDNTVYWSKQEEDGGQIHRGGWCPDYNDPNNYLRDVYRSDSIYNYGKWNNPEFDKLIDDARVESDPAKRLEMYTQAETLLSVEDSATMVLYYTGRPQVTRTGLQRSYSPAGTEYYWEWDLTE
jgi:oligopeptide transport system substrate-binding protein